jgi:hypothetical protein
MLNITENVARRKQEMQLRRIKRHKIEARRVPVADMGGVV